MEIARVDLAGLARDAVGIFVNDKPYDLSRPINEDAHIRIVTFEDEEGKAIFWHSSAHLMAEAIEAIYPGTKFGIGPPIEQWLLLRHGHRRRTCADAGGSGRRREEDGRAGQAG